MPKRSLTGHFKIGDGFILWADQDAHELLGYSQGTLADMPVADVFPSGPGAGSELLQAPAVGIVEHLGVRLRTQDERELSVDMHGERMDDGCTLWVVRRVVRGLRRTRVDALTHRDALTGLLHRVPTLDELRQAGPRGGEARPRLLAACFFDINGFREINEQLGPAGGDAVLCEVARRLRAAAPPGAGVARVGGDEFALVGWVGGEAPCREMLAQILARLAHPCRWGERAVLLRFSVGAALQQGGEQSTEVMLQHARQAAFIAKRSGAELRFFDAERALEERNEAEFRQCVRRGLAAREFLLAYQPQVDMLHGRVLGVEALVRWQHPERGLLQPDAFIPPIEEDELVEQLGDWAIGEALRQAADWLAQGVRISVSVNVSPRALLQDDFAGRLAWHLAQHPQLHAGVLELEILETTAIKDLAAVAGFIDQCATLGVPVTLDDFGTGYSSLAYLRHLPVSAVKLDRTFVGGILHSPDDRAIVQGILVMARGLGRRAIAEGVESVAHGRALLALGCTVGQGYGISRPLAPVQVADWIAAFERAPLWGRNEA